MATEEETTDSCVSVEATYSSIQNHVLARSCTSCHGSQGNVSLESYSQVVSGTNSAGNRVVTPFDPSNSRLYVTVNTGTMPLGGPALCNAKIQAIRTWIENGAAND